MFFSMHCLCVAVPRSSYNAVLIGDSPTHKESPLTTPRSNRCYIYNPNGTSGSKKSLLLAADTFINGEKDLRR